MFKKQYNYYLNLVEQYLQKLPFQDNLISHSMNYSLIGGGKRVRPVLALACVDLVGGTAKEYVREAAAIELIHTYSLIHDDLPAMDDDDYRRGRLSNHKKFGEAVAILAGDGLLTLAFELLAQPLDISHERQLRIIRETAQASGWEGMVGGQVLDTFGNGQKSSLENLEKIHQMKTGALLVLSARLGAILGGATEEEITKISQYAAHIGLAFQIKDDILDVTGESELLGKPAGSDIKHDKLTYPSLLGLEGAIEHLNNTITSAKEIINSFGPRAEFLISLANYIAERKN